MRALVFSAIRQVTMQDVPEPTPNAEQAIVKVHKAGICGSDLTGFTGHSPRRQPGLVLGHEAIGTVEHLPAGKWPVAVGQRVVLNPLRSCLQCELCLSGFSNICPNLQLIGMDHEPGAFAERVAVVARNVFPLGDGVSDDQGVMVEPLAVGVHLFRLIEKHNFGTLAIYGAGTQGILLLQLAKLLGYRDVAVVDTNPQRLAVAGESGATLLLNAKECDTADELRKWTGGKGVDIGIEAAGVTATRQNAIKAARRGGEVMLLGNHDILSDIDLTHVVRSEIRLQGSYAYTPGDFATAQKLLERGDVSIEAWTETRPITEGQAAFDMLIGNPGSTLKVILAP